MPRNFVGQIIDGLDVLIEQWQATAEYLETGYCDAEYCIRECSNAYEAHKLSEFYTEIRDHLQAQLAAASRKHR